MRITLPNSRTFSKIFQKATGKSISEEINGIATDSREVQKGDLYIAIKGEKVDGSDFLGQVFENGATYAMNGTAYIIYSTYILSPLPT